MTIDIVPHFAFYALPDLFAIGKGENTSSPAASLSHATLLQPGRQVSLSAAEGEVLLSHQLEVDVAEQLILGFARQGNRFWCVDGEAIEQSPGSSHRSSEQPRYVVNRQTAGSGVGTKIKVGRPRNFLTITRYAKPP